MKRSPTSKKGLLQNMSSVKGATIPPPLAATNQLPLRLVDPGDYHGYLVVDARGRSLCQLYNWYEEGGKQHTVPDEEVRAVGEWIVAMLNATAESVAS